MIEHFTAAEVDQMRPAGAFVAEVLAALREAADVGVNLLDLDALAARMIADRGARSCYVDYHPSFGAMPFGSGGGSPMCMSTTCVGDSASNGRRPVSS